MDRIYDLSEYPFTIIENAILESNLSAHEKLVLIALKRFAGRSDRAWPGRKAIGRLASCSEATVKRVLKKLEEKDLLRIIRREGGTNIYLLPGYEIREGDLVPVWPEVPFEEIYTQYSGRNGNENPENRGNLIAGEKSGKIEEKTSDIPDLTKMSEERPKRCDRKRDDSGSDYSSEERVEIVRAWEETFGRRFPLDGDLSDRVVKAADYMIYLVKSGRLMRLRNPEGYLRKLCAVEIEPFPDFFTRERMVREAEERMKRLEKFLIRQVEARMREEMSRLRGPRFC